jgi:hypothetical protein
MLNNLKIQLHSAFISIDQYKYFNIQYFNKKNIDLKSKTYFDKSNK